MDFLQYLFNEVKARRLDKAQALGMLRQLGGTPAQAAAPALHPLLQENTSSLHEQRFTTVFDGAEFFLRDHRVRGRRMLPGVVYLEMARAAAELAGGVPVALRDIVWARPLQVDAEPVRVHIGLHPRQQDEIGFEVYTEGAEESVHAQGIAVPMTAEAPPVLDLAALRRSCPRLLAAETCYAAFAALGVDYGPAQRGIARLAVGADGGRPLVMAKLQLPAVVASTWGDYGLHPSLIDSAAHAAFGLMFAAAQQGGQPRLLLPFALQSLELFRRCPADAWVVIRGGADGDKVQQIDVDVCDGRGEVCVRMRGFSVRVLDIPTAAAARAPAQPEPTPLFLVPVWTPTEHPGGTAATIATAVVGGRAAQRALLREHCAAGRDVEFAMDAPVEAIAAALAAAGAWERLVWIVPEEAPCDIVDDALIEAQQRGVLGCFRLIKALLQLGYGERVLQLTVVTTGAQAYAGHPVHSAHAGVHGLIGSLAKEYPQWRVALVDLEPGRPWPAAELLAVPSEPQGQAWVHRDGRWSHQQLLPWNASAESAAPAFRQGGVYVVIGGAGGIGEVCSEYLVRRYQAHIVWIGRRPLDAEIAAKLERLGAAGPAPLYLSADIADRAALQAALVAIKQRHARIDGVLHTAVVLADKTLANMDEERFRAALSAKVAGSVRMAQVFAGEALDLVLFFSSMQSFARAPGQSNYAAACTFQDAFAQQLAAAWSCPVKIMNWGYWGSVGSVADAGYRERMARMGVGSIEPADGMAALETLVQSPQQQLAFLKTLGSPTGALARSAGVAASGVAPATHGDGPKVPPLRAVKGESGPAAAALPLRDQAVAYFKELLSQTLKIPPEQLDPAEPLERYGMDSMLVMHITQVLRTVFSDVRNTLFFEHQSIDAVVDHFVATDPEGLRRLLQGHSGQAAAEPIQAGPIPAGPIPVAPELDALAALPAPPRLARRRAHRFLSATPAVAPAPCRDIAIIGLAGRFPQADSVEEYWHNLSTGVDCITEVPGERWSLEGFFNPDRNAALAQGLSYSKWGGFLKQASVSGEGVAPLDTGPIDPQIVLFQDMVRQLLAGAGHGGDVLRERYRGRVGVYVGALSDTLGAGPISAIANAVSGVHALQGPSLAVDTMSSSSMTAIHLACEGLLAGSCEAAIAGGIYLLNAEKYARMSRMRLLGSHHDSRSFSDGDGLLPCEGVGAVLLKPLAAAEADGDDIIAVIKSTAINHAGTANGLPNFNAQVHLVTDNIARAGIDARSISYVEASANGSPLGDAIEVAALARAFGGPHPDWRCVIGSVKSNIGHGASFSGIAQLAKVVLQLKHGQLIPTIKAERLNPELRLADTPFALERALTPWLQPDGADRTPYPRRALINSFGAGGSYAGAIVEEYQAGAKRANAQSDDRAAGGAVAQAIG